MNTQPASVASYESQVKQFKPEHGLAAANLNDLRLFLYEWFTHFEHAASSDFYLSHLDDKKMHVAFPGAAPLTTSNGRGPRPASTSRGGTGGGPPSRGSSVTSIRVFSFPSCCTRSNSSEA